MHKLAFIFCLSFAGAAQAQDCPDFYRFVDFGLEDDAGLMYRGGPIFRAEDFDETPLLVTQGTVCLDVRPTLTDGRGNPMPVVSSIQYNPVVADLDVADLRLSAVADSRVVAEVVAARYRDWLADDASTIVRGETFLCAMPAQENTLGCQLVSPYAGNVPLVVYCNASACAMMGLAVNETLVITARWGSDQRYLDDPETAALENTQRIQAIFDFLDPLSASN